MIFVVLVRDITAEQWRVLRDIRLAALRDAPSAFGSTYADEVALTERDWRSRAAKGSMFLAYLSETNVAEPVGLAGGYKAAGHRTASLDVAEPRG
jgi:hypothetical protein